MSVKQNPSPTPVLNRQYQDGWNTNQNQMKNTTSFYIVFQVLRVYTFVTLSGFYPLSNPPPPPPPPPHPAPRLFVTDKIKMDGIYTDQNQMKNTHPFYIVFKIICKMQPLDVLFLVVLCYISIYHSSLIFRASYNIIRKIDFCYNFSFF